MALPSLTGESKVVVITTAQLSLIAAALRHCAADPAFAEKSDLDQQTEMPMMAAACEEIAGDQNDGVYGLAL